MTIIMESDFEREGARHIAEPKKTLK